MNRIAVAALPLLCAAWAVAQTVSITGTVKDDKGAAVSGARVSLVKLPHLVATSKSDGTFQLAGSGTGALRQDSRPAGGLAQIRGDKLHFTLLSPERNVRVDVFARNGARKSAFHLDNLESGSHALALGSLPQGVHLVRLSLSQETRTVLLVSGAGQGLVSSGFRGPAAAAALAKTSAAVDSIILTAPGHKHALVGIDIYSQTGVQGVLSSSNPWKPAAALEKSKGMVKILAKGHDFEMGQPDPDIGGKGLSGSEQPMRTVSFTKDFWLDTVEVTQGDYGTLMAATYTGYEKPHWAGQYGVGDSHPTYHVDWSDAVLYCNARSKRDGFDTVYSYTSRTGLPGSMVKLNGVKVDLGKNGYRLPTEAEWEYAARGGSAADHPWGKAFKPYPGTPADSAEIGSYAVWKGNSWDLGSEDAKYGTQKVGNRKPNAYGLYDMIGNLFEWCNDWYAAYAPASLMDPTGPATGSYRTLRGGSWGHDAIFLRASNRIFEAPDYEYYFIGFRVARTVP